MWFLAILTTVAFAAAPVDPVAESARAKITNIKKNKSLPGSTIVLTSEELNAWARAELGEEKSLGVRDPKISLGPGSLHIEATADFGKIVGGKKNQDGMLARMLSGDRQIKIATRPEAAGGKLTLHVDLVQISGLQLSGTILNLAAKMVISQLSGDVVLDEPFKIGHNIDSASVSPAGVRINIAGPLPTPSRPGLPAGTKPPPLPPPTKPAAIPPKSK